MFPDNYREPWDRDYKARTEDVVLYSHYEKYRNEDEDQYCEFCDEELGYDSESDTLLDCDCEDSLDERKHKGNHAKITKITLQSILDMLPEGVKPSDVKISTSLDLGDMGIYGHSVTFSYSKTFKADPEGFKAAKKLYEKNYKAYLVEKEKYDEWKHNQEVKDLEVKLANAKNKRKP